MDKLILFTSVDVQTNDVLATFNINITNIKENTSHCCSLLVISYYLTGVSVMKSKIIFLHASKQLSTSVTGN